MRAQTILDYRTQNGPFERVEDAANVPGLTQTIVDSWAGMATVSCRSRRPWRSKKGGMIMSDDTIFYQPGTELAGF